MHNEGYVSQATWADRFKRLAAAELAASNDAKQARDTIKGALMHAIGSQVRDQFKLPTDTFVDVLYEAAWDALANDSENRIRRALEALAIRDTAAARASRSVLRFAFPDSEFVKNGLKQPAERRKAALSAADAAVPNAAHYTRAAHKGVEPLRSLIRGELKHEEEVERARAEDARRAAAQERARLREFDRVLEQYRTTRVRRARAMR